MSIKDHDHGSNMLFQYSSINVELYFKITPTFNPSLIKYVQITENVEFIWIGKLGEITLIPSLKDNNINILMHFSYMFLNTVFFLFALFHFYLWSN
jgi:hypothetical protein